MSFTIEEYKGYREGEKYTKHLKFVRMYGNSGCRYVIMKDEDGNEMTWTTRDSSRTYQNFRTKAEYKFKVKYIINNDKTINIERLELADKNLYLAN